MRTRSACTLDRLPTRAAATLLTLLALPVAAGAAEPAPSTSPEGQVAAVMRAQAEAWSRGDLEAFTAVYAEDTIFLSPSGVTRGRRQVLERYQKRYPDAAAMGKLTLEPIEARTFPAGKNAEGRLGRGALAARVSRTSETQDGRGIDTGRFPADGWWLEDRAGCVDVSFT